MKHLTIIVLIFALFSCEKAELPKPYQEIGNGEATYSVSMGSDYTNVLFFNLGSGTVVRTVDRSSWDLSFGTAETDPDIILNNAKHMALAVTGFSDLSQVTTSSGAVWVYDDQKGYSDSLALTGWELNKVYLVDRGLSSTGSQIGKVKFRIIAHTATSYTIEWAKLNVTSSFNTNVIEKSANQNFTHFSFNGTGAVVEVEPPKNTWDLCFTSFTYIYPDHTPYLVTGVLSNRYLVKIYEAQEAFENIDLADATGYNYSDDLDVIGFDWKTYDFDSETYTIDFSKVYVIKSVDGNYYKLRFLDFYDVNGVKGTPSFELVKIVD